MRFAFDHIVHYVEDPMLAIEALKDKGIYAIEGGIHEKFGTYNVLSYFDLSYIEFLGTYDRELIAKTEHPQFSLRETIVKDGFYEGFSRIALRTTDIEGDAQRFRDNGLIVNGPFPFSRKRPDGSKIEWQLLYFGAEKEELQFPFIIQWNENDEERRNEQIKKNVIRPHLAGANFSHASFAVRNLKKTITRWSTILGLQAEDSYIDETLQAECQVLELKGGNLVFCSPIGDGFVSDVLTKRGERPFQVTLTNDFRDETFELLGGIYQLKSR